MTFPSTVKKSGPITILKTKPGSKTSTGSPRSPVSPLNAPIKLISGSPDKVPLTNKTTEKTNVGSPIKSPLTNKPIEKTNVGSPVKKLSVSLNSPTVKKLSTSLKSPAVKLVSKSITDAKPEPEKKIASTTREETKSVMKPPPLKLNIKSTDSKELKSPVTPKSIPKTPTSPSVKSFKLTKSPMPIKSTLATRSPSVSSGVIKLSSSVNILSQASTVSPSVTKSQVTSGTKTSTTSSEVKYAVASSPVAKSPSFVSKPSMVTSIVPKSPRTSTNLSISSVKSVSSKDQVTVMKPTSSPVKKAVVSSSKNVTGVKLPITSVNKPSAVPRSPTTVSSTKSSCVKTPASPLKLLKKEPSTVKISPSLKSIVNNKSNVIAKPDLTSSKVVVQKEPSSLSLISVKSSSTIKSSSSAMSKTSSQKAKVTSMSVSKSVVPPKSPIAKTSLLTVAKTTQSSPTKKTSSSLVVKTSIMSSVVNSKTPLSPISKTRTLSLSSEKSSLSPTVKKAVPTKLILSPGLPKTKSLSSTKLSSISTENLSSRLSLKSPISPKPTKDFTQILSRSIKKTEEPKAKSIRGGQPLKKTIDIPGITELPSNIVLNNNETLDVECKLENTVQNILKKEIGSTLPPQILLDQNLPHSKELETINVFNIDDGTKVTFDSDKKNILSNSLNSQNVNISTIVEDHNLQTIEENSIVEFTSIKLLEEHKQEENLEYCSSLDFVMVKKDECEPRLNNISQSPNNFGIVIDDNHFGTTNDVLDQLNATESYILDTEDNFEPMNDKLVLGDAPFETDSSQSDISDTEQTAVQKEITINGTCSITEKSSMDDVFLFSEHDLSINNFNRIDSTENFIQQFMPQSEKRSKGASSISTDDGSLGRKSYSEVVSGSPKDGDYYYDYDIDVVDDCLEYDDEENAVFVEVTEKEFPELKPKDMSGKRKKNKKQKKRNFSYRTGSQSDSNISEDDYNPEKFDGNEFCHYIQMMKNCSFYPNGLFSSDSVKLSTSSSLSWLDISVRTTDDDLLSSTETLSTYEVFQASNLNRDFLVSIIGSTSTTNSTSETSWFWKSIESRNQPHNKANITLSLKPGPKHLTTPRFMTLLALISEAKGYEIQPSLSEHFVTAECMPRFDDKIRRLMVQGFWLVGRLIKESLSENGEVNFGNPFKFIDGDIGFWWAGINMLDWQEYLKECDKTQKLINCYEFVMQNMNEKRHNFMEAELSMNAAPDDFMSELDVVNFIHTVRNVKYYSGNCFVDSEQSEEIIETCDDDDNLIGWENNSGEQH